MCLKSYSAYKHSYTRTLNHCQSTKYLGNTGCEGDTDLLS